MKPTKYEYLYVLQGNYGFGHGWEDLSAEPQTFVGRRAIRTTRQEYRDNEGGNYRIIRRRELREQVSSP